MGGEIFDLLLDKAQRGTIARVVFFCAVELFGREVFFCFGGHRALDRGRAAERNAADGQNP